MVSTLTHDLELGIDAIADVMRGSEFARRLLDVYAMQRVALPYRDLVAVYVDEVETPDGYPACELVAASSDYDTTNQSELIHQISMQFTVNGSDEEIMSRECKRLIAAARKLFNGPLPPYVGGYFRSGRSDYGPASPGRQEDYVRSAALQIFWHTTAD